MNSMTSAPTGYAGLTTEFPETEFLRASKQQSFQVYLYMQVPDIRYPIVSLYRSTNTQELLKTEGCSWGVRGA